VIAWLALFAVAAASPSSFALTCETTDAAPFEEESADASPADDPFPLTITLQQRGRRILAVLVDGPPLLSSYADFQVFTGTPDSSGGVQVQRQLLPKRGQWRGKYRGDGIDLRRSGSSISLSPQPDGSYAGSWSFNQVFEGHIHMNGGGDIRCRRRGTNGSEAS
jgi:hypothetical protein